MKNPMSKDITRKIIAPIFNSVVFILCGIFMSHCVQAQQNQLQLKPAQCIALHEGQVCYQTLVISWQVATMEKFCLYQQNQKEPLTCWDAQLNGKMRIEFEGKSSQKFYIQRSQDEKNVAEFTFEVAWVYDASTHRDNGSHWRIF
jgi:hypothetical protein